MVLSRNLNAILVGVFTLVSSVISSLLGYYFAHEDRQSMMRLEYDKLRAEHTLEVAKSIATAEAHMNALSAEGSMALSMQCLSEDQVKTLEADVNKVRPLAALSGSTDYKLMNLERHLKFATIDTNVRDLLLLQLDQIKATQSHTEETLTARSKIYEGLYTKLLGDTTATVQIYHGDRIDDFGQLASDFLAVNIEAQRLLTEPKCANQAAFDKLSPRMLDWNMKAIAFVQTLGIAIKPN